MIIADYLGCGTKSSTSKSSVIYFNFQVIHLVLSEDSSYTGELSNSNDPLIFSFIIYLL